MVLVGNESTKFQDFNQISRLVFVSFQDACKRDSGGPLVSRFGTKSTIVGVVSWGLGCAAATYPGVYTRLKNN